MRQINESVESPNSSCGEIRTELNRNWVCFEIWSYLPGGPRSPMMCMVCIELWTTWLFFTNSSVGSQLMIFDTGIVQSLRNTPDPPVTWWITGLKTTSSIFISNIWMNVIQYNIISPFKWVSWCFTYMVRLSCRLCLMLAILSARKVGLDLVVVNMSVGFCYQDQKQKVSHKHSYRKIIGQFFSFKLIYLTALKLRCHKDIVAMKDDRTPNRIKLNHSV